MRKRILTGVLAAMAIGSVLGAPQASAQPAGDIGTSAEAANVPVHAVADAYIRSSASTGGERWGNVRFGEDWEAICFTEGGDAELGGKHSDIWVQLDQWGPSNGFVTELALEHGHANMPHC
ncbi:MAG TPA: hypothetical protein VNS49_04615 [Streptomyces sp.]|nr:hypothetical protein [Streptomyces sp.]